MLNPDKGSPDQQE